MTHKAAISSISKASLALTTTIGLMPKAQAVPPPESFGVWAKGDDDLPKGKGK